MAPVPASEDSSALLGHRNFRMRYEQVLVRVGFRGEHSPVHQRNDALARNWNMQHVIFKLDFLQHIGSPFCCASVVGVSGRLVNNFGHERALWSFAQF